MPFLHLCHPDLSVAQHLLLFKLLSAEYIEQEAKGRFKASKVCVKTDVQIKNQLGVQQQLFSGNAKHLSDSKSSMM